MRLEAVFLLAALATPACSLGIEDRFLALPDRATAKTVVLALQTEGPEALFAGAADRPLELVAGDEPQRMHLLLFDRTLEELGLPAGPIADETLAARGADCRLGRPDQVMVSAIVEGRPQSWAAAPLPPQIHRRLAPHFRCVRCGPLREFRVPSPPHAAESATFLPSGAAMVALQNGTQHRLTLSGLEPITGCEGAQYFAALNISRNQVWLGTHGAAVRVTIDEEAKRCRVEERRELAPERSGERLFHLALDGDLIALTSSGAIERWENGRFVQLAIVPLHDGDRDEGSRRGGLAAIDGTIYASAGAPRVEIVAAEGRRTERLDVGPLGTAQRIESLAEVEGLGVYAGDDVGRVFHRENSGRWVAQTEGPVFESVGTIAGFRDGVVASLRSTLVEFPAGGGRCNDLPFGGDTERRLIAGFDRILFPQTLVGSDFPEDEFLWLVIEP